MIIAILLYCGNIMFSQTSDSREVATVVHDIDYRLYHSFSIGSKVKLLQEESTLKFYDDLPLLDGATALYPVYSAFVRAVYPEIPPRGYAYNMPYESMDKPDKDKLIIRCMQTPMAYINLINGNVDMIFCAEPSREQITRAAERNITFNLLPIGMDAFVFFVNKNNPIDNISSEQIQAIYSGAMTNWYSINGNDEPIIAYQRPQNSGSQTILEQVIMAGKAVMEPVMENVIGGMGGIIEKVASYKNYANAIGYSFLFFTTEMVNNDEIKLISIDGVYPSKETIQNGEYPFIGPFYAITRGDETENMRKLIDWILSDQGQYLVENTGYIPIN
jgi:phosphate transport system substrate-binding protein